VIDLSAVRDTLAPVGTYQRDPAGLVPIRGWVHVVLTGPDGEVKLDEIVENLITQVGDQYYGERAAGLAGAPSVVTGMQLGTGSTAPTKTGAAAALGALVPSSLVALTGNPVSALNGAARRISYAASWGAGVATANGIAEVALVNQAIGTQTIAPAAATIARALLNPVVNKGANDTLAVTWHHDLTGA
jgi:hypothetical protein